MCHPPFPSDYQSLLDLYLCFTQSSQPLSPVCVTNSPNSLQCSFVDQLGIELKWSWWWSPHNFAYLFLLTFWTKAIVFHTHYFHKFCFFLIMFLSFPQWEHLLCNVGQSHHWKLHMSFILYRQHHLEWGQARLSQWGSSGPISCSGFFLCNKQQVDEVSRVCLGRSLCPWSHLVSDACKPNISAVAFWE